MIKGKQRMRITVLFSVIMGCCILATSCQEGTHVTPSTVDPQDLAGVPRTITVTVRADTNITLTKNPATFQADSDSTWDEIKVKALSLVTANSGYRLGQWRLGSSTGKILSDTDVFSVDTIVYAQSVALPPAAQQVTITVNGGANVTVNGTSTIIVEKNSTTWGSIKDQAQSKLSFTSGYTLDGWKKGSASGTALTDGETFAGDTNVYAVARLIAAPPPSTPGDKVFTANGVTFTMKKIPDSVELSHYYLGETEVTQRLWQAVMGTTPSYHQGASYPPAMGERPKERPVENVSWYQCIDFCNKLTMASSLPASQCVYYRESSLTNVYTASDAAAKTIPHIKFGAQGFRLPKEEEWQWVAKGGSANKKWAGTNDEDDLQEYAWYYHSSGSKTHQVKKLKPNAYGLYDMSGNVYEWCWDKFGGTTDQSVGSLRGGDYRSGADRITCTFRYPGYDYDDKKSYGLRVCCKQ